MPIPSAPLLRGARGPEVADLHSTLDNLGLRVDRVERLSERFGVATEALVREFQTEQGLEPTGEFDALTRARAVEWFQERAPFLVRGQVVDVDGEAIGGVAVVAIDVDLRRDEPLGTATTNRRGGYELRYSPAAFVRADKGNADLLVRARDDERTIAESAILFNAAIDSEVNLRSTGRRRGPSEQERLEAALTPVLDDIPVHELTTVPGDRLISDVDFLAAETGEDRQRIAWLATAAQLARAPLRSSQLDELSKDRTSTTPIPAAAFYGWFRLGLPTEPAGLLAIPADTLIATLKFAVDERIIPETVSAELDAIDRVLRQEQARAALDAPRFGDAASLNEVLGTLATPLETDRLDALAAMIDDLRPDDPQLVTRIATIPGLETEAPVIARTMRLAALTGGYVPLVRELQGLTADAAAATGTPAIDLRPIARLEVDEWRAILERPQPNGEPISFPPGTSGRDDDERLDNYARSLARAVEEAVPTAVIAAKVARDVGEGSPFTSTRDDLTTFFDDNPGFELGIAPVDLYLQDGRDEKLAHVGDPEALQTRLDDLGRMFKLTPRYAEIRVMMADDLHSASGVVNLGKRAFIERYAEPLGGPERAEEIFGNAERVHAGALNLYMRFGAAFNAPMPYVVSGNGSIDVLGDDTDVDLPAPKAFRAEYASAKATWTRLFGSLDLCACAHCASLYSPAAYFVDIMRFLDGVKTRVRAAGTKRRVTALQVLLARRPDLEHIELDCHNTNTLMPYVDLANELLEASVTRRRFTIMLDPGTAAAVRAALDDRAVPADFPPRFADHGYVLDVDASVRIDTDADGWIILDEGWVFSVVVQETDAVFSVAAWPQTSWSANELSANPEHVHDDAYATLREAVAPWDLPFDLSVTEARTYLHHLGVPRPDLMEAFFPGTPDEALSDPAVAFEHLGLTAVEAGIITGAITRDARPVVGGVSARPWDFWGLERSGNDLADPSDASAARVTGDWSEVLRHVPVLLHRAGLTYRELLELVGTFYLNPLTTGEERTLRIVAVEQDGAGRTVDPATCRQSLLRLDGSDAEVELALARIHRFVRLWRRLGWSARELDQAITAFSPEPRADGFDGFLVRLAHVARLRAAFDLPIVTLLSWWSDIDTAAYVDHVADDQPQAASLYEQLFRNKSVLQPLDQTFTEDAAALTGNISDHAAGVAAGLGIDAADLALLTTGQDAVLVNDDLDLRNISQLHRTTSLARALRLSIRDYLAIVRLSGGDPFAGTTLMPETATTLRFAELATATRDSDFSIDDLAQLLRHEIPSSDVVPADEVLALTLDDVRHALQRVAEETELPDTDQDGELTRKGLAVLNWEAVLVDGVVGALSGSTTYEVLTDVFATRPALPNDDGSTSTPLAAVPAGLTFPAELDGVVSIDPQLLFVCDGSIAVEGTMAGQISPALRQQFSDHQIDLATTAAVTTDVADETWTIAVRYSVVRTGTILAVFDLDALTLRSASRLGGPERSILVSLSTDPGFAGAVDDLLRQQVEMEGRIVYDEVTVDGGRKGRLRFTGSMTNARKNRLDTVSTDPDYRAAIQSLYDAPRDLVARYARTFEVHDFVTDLDVLPSVTFPPGLRRRISFESSSIRSRLHFLGVMTVDEREALLELSTDVPYRDAINELFDQAQPGSPREIVPTPDDVFLTAADIAAVFDDPSEPATRFQHVLEPLVPRLRTILSERAVVQQLAESLQLESQITRDLLTRWIDAPAHSTRSALAELREPAFAESNGNVPLTRSAFPDQFAALTLLTKVAAVIGKLRPTARQLDWLFKRGAGRGWLDLNGLPVVPLAPTASSATLMAGWRRLQDVFQLRVELPFGEMGLFDLIAVADAAVAATADDDRNTAKATYLAMLSRLTTWSLEDLEALLGPGTDHQHSGALGLTFPDDYTDERVLRRLQRCFRRLKRLGAAAGDVAGWAAVTPTVDEARAAANGIKSAAKSKYSASDWHAVAAALKAPMRERQRVALVSYLVAHPDPARRQTWTAVDELYEHLLVDVQMDPCMTTTRILQATNSVQLFVQRCLMNLEPGITLDADDVREWTSWRKQYRIWEANRKVLFYPENWIEPELRDDKSPFFAELESELSESDLTMDTAEDAFLQYLEKVDQVARLEIVGVCHQREPGDPARHAEPIDILHVFGRTAATPHRYFYRRWDRRVWSAWERVDADIESDHLIPVIWNRRLHLFWAMLTEVEERPTKAQRQAEDDAAKYWKIELAWSELRHTGWSPKRLSSASLMQPQLLHTIQSDSLLAITASDKLRSLTRPQLPRDVSFKSRVEGKRLVIGCYGGAKVPHERSVAEVIPAPPVPTTATLLRNVVSHRDFFGNRMGTAFVARFTVDGALPTAEQRDRISIRFRDPLAPNVPPDPVRLNTNGAARSPDVFVTDSVLAEVVLTGFRVTSIVESGSWWGANPEAYVRYILETIKDAIDDEIARPGGLLNSTSGEDLMKVVEGLFVGAAASGGALIPVALAAIPAAAGAASAALSAAVAMLARQQWGWRVLVDLQPLPAPQPTTVYRTVVDYALKRMRGIGEFTLNDVSGTLQARTMEAEDMLPTELAPIPGARIEHMMLVEEPGPSDHALTVGVDARNAPIDLLQATPGRFRLVAPAHDPQFALTSPFFFQDDHRAYLVTHGDGQPFEFSTHFHPRIGDLVTTLKRDGIPGLLRLPDLPVTDDGATFMGEYRPTPVYVPYVSSDSVPNERVDFTASDAYSLYNWELFFHIPFLIATQLSRNQRFAEAQRWFHYIFDPTSTHSQMQPADPGPERFWRVQPFHDEARRPIKTLQALLEDAGQLGKEVTAWQANPFKPHVIARLRIVAYMKAVVMRYLDNLVAWGDQLFRQDTVETINEATQLYVLAAQILGPRPDAIPPRATPSAQTFRTLDERGALNSLSNAIVEIESFLPPSAPPAPATGTEGGTPVMPYFCITANEKLLGYWDTVADRLFKIRHCLNFEGAERALPPFQPQIDPSVLVRATAAGVDLTSALADLTAPRPHYRFSTMWQKATELCNDVKALGAALLAALEKKEAEELALLRAGHEVELLESMRDAKQRQVDEAEHVVAGLQRYQDVVTARRDHYQSRPFLNADEQLQLDLLRASLLPMGLQAGAEVLAAILHLIPDAKLGFFTTAGTTYGGSNIAGGVHASGAAAGVAASILNTIGSVHATLGGHRRRQEDWAHQTEVANKELEQVAEQIAAAELRVCIAQNELASHDRQITSSKEVDDYLHERKFTSQELYSFMVGKLSGVYFEGYQLAYDVAKRAERTYRYELGLRDSNFIQFGYWDSLKKGLLCAERLHHDLKRMDVAYLEQNGREYEITKHVSLQLVDPIALLTLKETGDCFVTLPESLFDLDHPGHYLRRLRTVSLTIPCVTGPYTGVNCTLTQLQSSIRHTSTLVAGKYGRRGDDDLRFSDTFGSVQSIVTSSGQNDSGLFDPNLRDERYLPFEGKGAISTWRVQLPKQFRTFDHDTISDVILHVRYTAREGGEVLRQHAATELRATLDRVAESDGAAGLARAFSLRHEFPSEWHRFLHPAGDDQTLTVTLGRELFPYQFHDRIHSIDGVELYVKVRPEFVDSHNDATVRLAFQPGREASSAALGIGTIAGLLHATRPQTGPLGDWTLTAWLDGDPHLPLVPEAIQDLLLVCRYTV